MEKFDITIVGAGPVGLYAAYYAGMRGFSVHLIENFDVPGGQPLNVYPEKHIFDIAGFPKINGLELTGNLLEQLEYVDYTLSVNTQVEKIEKVASDFEIMTNQGIFQSRSVLFTSGQGLLKPKKLGVENEFEAKKKGKLNYFVKLLDEYKNKKVVVFGGGDSALDWSLMLEKVASEVHIVHRRKQFRALEGNVKRLDNSEVIVHVPYVIDRITDSGVKVKEVKGNEILEIVADKILVNFGFDTDHNEIASGLELDKDHQILVDRGMKTNLDGIYAAGDCCIYPTKVAMITVGFGEAVVAINDIANKINFDHEIRNGHSSSLFE